MTNADLESVLLAAALKQMAKRLRAGDTPTSDGLKMMAAVLDKASEKLDPPGKKSV